MRVVDFIDHFRKVLFDRLPMAFTEFDADAVRSWGFACDYCFDYFVEFLFTDWFGDKRLIYFVVLLQLIPEMVCCLRIIRLFAV